MSQNISEYIGVDPITFDATGAFDGVLDLDSKFYIDPLLLKVTEVAELKYSYERLNKRFEQILKLLSKSQKPGDLFWRNADRLLPTKELEGICIGYSMSGTRGSGMGEKFRAKILATMKEVVSVGISDPEIFGLVGILEEGVGCDRISDMVGGVIAEDILTYSQRVYVELGAKTRRITYKGNEYQLPINPHNSWPLLLVPSDILRPLPIARSYNDIDRVCEHNRRLRERVNQILGRAGHRMSVGLQKQTIRQALLSRPDLLTALVDDYANGIPPKYDFNRDPSGEGRWRRYARQYSQNYPLPLSLPSDPTPEDLIKVVLDICDKFRDLVENNGLHELMYEKGAKAKHESAAQKLFYGIADSYCRANNLDLSAEIDSGRGAVDFKFSKGYKAKIIVELKLSTHQRLKHGFETQIAEYQKAEKTAHSIFLLIHVANGSMQRVHEIRQLATNSKKEGKRIPELVIVRAISKPSASKYKPSTDEVERPA